MKILTINDIIWELSCEYCNNSIDIDIDIKTKNYIIKELNKGNIWIWCDVKLTGEYLNIKCSDYLSQCSYKNEIDFKNGGYYEDMQNIILNDINKSIEDIIKGYYEILDNYPIQSIPNP